MPSMAALWKMRLVAASVPAGTLTRNSCAGVAGAGHEHLLAVWSSLGEQVTLGCATRHAWVAVPRFTHSVVVGVSMRKLLHDTGWPPQVPPGAGALAYEPKNVVVQ